VWAAGFFLCPEHDRAQRVALAAPQTVPLLQEENVPRGATEARPRAYRAIHPWRASPREKIAMVAANDNIPLSRRLTWPELMWPIFLWLCPPVLTMIALLGVVVRY
jgi:hypothetical protein